MDLRLRINIVPLADLDLVHAPHVEEDPLSAISMTARSKLGAEWERKVGRKGGPTGTAWGAPAKRAWAAPPSHNLTLPTTPFPTHNTWSMLGKSEMDKSPATAGASWGGGVQVRGVALVVAAPGAGGLQFKNKSPLRPIFGVVEGRPPMVVAGCHHQQHVPPLQLNGVPSRLCRIPQGRPCLHRHLVVL